MIEPHEDHGSAAQIVARRLKVSGAKSAYKSALTYPPFGHLGEFANVKWKADRDGGQECYFVPNENLKVWEMVYLRRAGIRQLKQWAKLETEQRGPAISAWIKACLVEKGITIEQRPVM